ncbi:MAG: sulfurtransferase [Proteobacteria bacterium]|nr:sulfurtransferase [Pseudomonadota bacterium]MBU1737235.1 sulfurtransferase [Pseudomonadota bacterium]
MNLKTFFSKTNDLDSEQVRKFMADHLAEEYVLLDVRQPKEYEAEHLPGAVLAPMKELAEKLKELDPQKPVIVYCASGGRSTIAARFLSGKGFQEVYNLSGGIKKWFGRKATGPEIQGLELLDSDGDYQSGIVLAYALEDGLQKFYARLAALAEGAEEARLLERLAGFEDKHKAWLMEEYRHLVEDRSAIPEIGILDDTMEGGRSVSQFLARVRPEFLTLEHIFELAMMFETQAMDLYSRLAHQASEPTVKDLFYRLIEEENMHLGFLEKEYNRLMV